MPRNPLMAAGGLFEPDPNNPLTGNYTAADAADWHRQNAADTWQAIQDPQTWQDAADQYRSGMLMGSTAPEMKGLGLDAAAMKVLRDMTPPGFRAYHGSPHSFDQFSSDKIGTGEGAQAFGHGLYFADSEGVARSYRDALSDPQFDGGPYNPDNLAHRAAAYLDRAKGDPKAATASLDFEHQQMQAKIDDLKRRFPMLSEDTILNGRGRIWADEQQRIAETRDMVNDPTAKLPVVSSKGHMYEVNVAADPAHMLDWDKPWSQQSPAVQEALRKVDIPGGKTPPPTDGMSLGRGYKLRIEPAQDGSSSQYYMEDASGRRLKLLEREVHDFVGVPGVEPTGEAMHALISKRYGGPAAAAQALRDAGIPGIRYLDGGSRAGGEGTRNSVIFDPATIAILRKYGLAGLMAGGGAAASGQSQQ